MASVRVAAVAARWGRLPKRRLVQVASLVGSNAYVLSALKFLPCGYLQCSNCPASTFTCPLILVQKAAVMAGMGMLGGPLAAKITGSVVAAVAVVVLFGALFGTWACGWLCPFGFLQDLLGKLWARRLALPGWAGYLRLPLLLGLVGVAPYLSRSMLFCDVCPPGTINRLWQQAAGLPLLFKTPAGIWAVLSLVVLGAVLLTAVFVQRPFCTVLCPIGGVQGLLNRVSGVYLHVDRDLCVSCGRCAARCPQGLDPVATPAHSQCSRCFECTGTCKALRWDVRA